MQIWGEHVQKVTQMVTRTQDQTIDLGFIYHLLLLLILFTSHFSYFIHSNMTMILVCLKYGHVTDPETGPMLSLLATVL